MKNTKQSRNIPELDAFIAEGIATEEEVAVLSSKLSIAAKVIIYNT